MSCGVVCRGGHGGGVIKYFCSFSNTIYDVLASRGWVEVEADEDVSSDAVTQ